MGNLKNSFEKDRKPNVIWVLVDQMRAQAMGFTGDPNVRTPNLDNLARDGVAFTSAVSGTPWCCPFRGALLTSLYPQANGVTETPSPLKPTIPTITAPFKDAGYHTSWIGKWHLDGSNLVTHYIPPERRGGFDYFMGFENNNNQNESYVFGNDSEKPVRLKGYETDSLTEMFIEHLRNHVGGKEDYQPFFSVLSVQPPHNPYVPPTDVTGEGKYYHNPSDIKLRPNVPPAGKWPNKARRDLAGYYGMIENIDTNIGKLRMALKELDVDRETYIIFMSDHGDCLSSHGQCCKSSPWEESIRIPFIVSCVGSAYHMKTGFSNSLVNHIDIAPTTLGLCGIDIPKSMVGYDYSSECIKRDRLEYHEAKTPSPESAYLQQIPRKFQPHTIHKEWRGVVTKDGWKYICTPGAEFAMFDLNDDPYEMANLCFDIAYQKEKERLHKMLQDYIIDTKDEFKLPDITVYNGI